MKILFVIENYFPHIGGVEVVFKNLAEGLAAEGHDVNVITHRVKGTVGREKLNGVKIRRISCFGSRYLFTFFAIPAALKAAGDADVVHTTTFNGFFPAWLAAKLNRKPVVATIHEVWQGKWKKYTDMGWLKAWVHEMLEKPIYMLPFVDKYIAVSDSTRRQLLSIGKDEEKTKTIYNGVDYSYLNPRKYDGNKVRKRYGLQKNYVILVYGRPGPSKGIEYAVMAMKDIVAKIPNAKMMLILTRDRQYMKKYNRLFRMVRRLGIENIIVKVEPVSYKELPNYIKASDCVVVPSLSEGFGYTAAEAAAMGKAAVVSNTTSLPEVASGKHILVTPKKPSEIAEGVIMIKEGKIKSDKLKKFTIQKNVEEYLGVYERLLNE